MDRIRAKEFPEERFVPQVVFRRSPRKGVQSSRRWPGQRAKRCSGTFWLDELIPVAAGTSQAKASLGL
jgi:hypothetical protein